ncbi:hypothetical protein [Streptomyces sp. NPDC048392]|uniref:hypothetical protein n=1 Tax=Streptomyces sp. NPDC048392 TaxID=3365543 RepID=UPI0037158B2B
MIEGAEESARRLDDFAGVVEKRDATLLAISTSCRPPRRSPSTDWSIRPHVEGPHVKPVARRTALRHLDRLIDTGRITEVERGMFRAT